MEAILRTEEYKVYICPDCGNTKWRTVKKGRKWKCRQCGFISEKED